MQKLKSKTVPISNIIVVDRERKDVGDLSELKRGIKDRGLLHPITVKELEGGQYKLLAGGRRFQACVELGYSEIDCRIKTINEDVDEYEIELFENIHREDLAWDEKAALKNKIHNYMVKKHGLNVSKQQDSDKWSMEKTAQLFGETTANTSMDIALAKKVELLPALRACKTKAEAQKLLNKAEEQLVTREIAKQTVEEVKSLPDEALLKRMLDSYMVGDFFEGIKECPDGIFHLVNFDPPYGINLHDAKRQQDETGTNIDSNYNEIDQGEFMPWVKAALKELYRVMREDSWLILWFGPDPWFQMLLDIVRNSGFIVRGLPGLWIKPNGQCQQPTRHLAANYEMFFYCRKGNAVISRAREGHTMTFHHTPVAPQKKFHPTEKPLELMTEIFETFATHGHVLSPCLGSGVDILAAYNLGMNCVGYELSEEYKQGFIGRAKDLATLLNK